MSEIMGCPHCGQPVWPERKTLVGFQCHQCEYFWGEDEDTGPNTLTLGDRLQLGQWLVVTIRKIQRGDTEDTVHVSACVELVGMPRSREYPHLHVEFNKLRTNAPPTLRQQIFKRMSMSFVRAMGEAIHRNPEQFFLEVRPPSTATTTDEPK